MREQLVAQLNGRGLGFLDSVEVSAAMFPVVVLYPDAPRLAATGIPMDPSHACLAVDVDMGQVLHVLLARSHAQVAFVAAEPVAARVVDV